ncbi:MAG: hypothetical protein ACFFAN_12275 [Promethearchaeota archaeon]
MSEKVPKNKYLVEEEIEEEEIEEEEIKEEKEEIVLERKILKILRKGKVDSKQTLTNLLINSGFKNFTYKINLISNELNAEIPNIGKILKSLRFKRKIKFSIINGSHVYFMDNNQKMIKSKRAQITFDWKTYNIPEGLNEINLIFKIPGSRKESRHFLSSCLPFSDFSGFKLIVDKKFEKTHSFIIFPDKLNGYFDDDKLILICKTSNYNTVKTLYTIIQIGRTILQELIKLNFRYSEVLKIIYPKSSDFFPVTPIFRVKERNAFYETKYSNALRIFYDFPVKFEGKTIFGKFSLIYNDSKSDTFELIDYYDFITKSFKFQTKSFLSLSILNDWVINPTKALNYIEQDDDLKKLIDEYIQDIDTERIIQERLEETLEKGEFIKEITTNLLLTLLGVSLLSNWPPIQWIVVGLLVIINVFYFYKRRKKFRKKTQQE